MMADYFRFHLCSKLSFDFLDSLVFLRFVCIAVFWETFSPFGIHSGTNIEVIVAGNSAT